jgi:hypothetical protein
MSQPTSLEMAKGFFTRRFTTFLEAARIHDPRYILLGDDAEAIRYDSQPWRSRAHRVWMCLLVAAAEGELKSPRARI